MTTTGRCLCGATRWKFSGAPKWSCYCHCDDCRRNCAAPIVAWLGLATSNFEWTGASPRTVKSSPGVRRHFCGACGSPMAFEADHYPGGMHLYAASMDDPTTFRPEFHVNVESKLPWLRIDDDLPKYRGTMAAAPQDMRNFGAE